MEIKKLILAVFIVFALNFSYQPVSIFTKERESIVFILDFRQDNFTNDFIKRNESRKFEILVSLTLQCLTYSNERIIFNTS